MLLSFKNLSLLVFLLLSKFFSARAQIISVDTICPGESVQFSTNQLGAWYTWSFEDVDISLQAPQPQTLSLAGNPLNTPSLHNTVNDGTNWYVFVTNYSSGNLIRLSYGNNPNSIPTATSLGTLGITGGAVGGINIIKDQMSGNWFGFIVANSQLVRLSFGTSLTNTPTSTVMNFLGIFAWPHDVNVQKIGNIWVGFVANRSGAITRLDFGNSITNTPTAINLPTTNYNAPVSFSLYQQTNNWHMLIAALVGPAGVTRLDFGTNIQNNNPVATNLGNFNNQLNLVRMVELVSDCDGLYAYVLNEYGNLFSLNFNNDITNPSPTLTTLSNPSANYFTMYMHENKLMANFQNTNSSTISRTVLKTYPASTITNYYNPNTSYTFTNPGLYNVTLWIDQGNIKGAKSYCKQIYVGASGVNLGPDTTFCGSGSLVLNNGASGTGYLWSTGETTPSITVNASGTYWVSKSMAGCNGSDTINVNFLPNPVLSTSNDTTVCIGKPLRISVAGAQTYFWIPTSLVDNPSSAQPMALPLETTTFIVTATDANGCRSIDSVMVAVNNPSLDIASEDDGVSCSNSSIQLEASGAVSYLWEPAAYCNNNNIPNPIVSPNNTTTFYVVGKDEYGCEAKDSIQILAFKESIFFVPDAFSPNNDGINDIFMPLIYCDFELSAFKVFNRYGGLEYSTHQAGKGWSGIKNGKSNDVGTYFWYIEGKDGNNKKIVRKGDVTLLR